jgi:hypothetical protein
MKINAFLTTSILATVLILTACGNSISPATTGKTRLTPAAGAKPGGAPASTIVATLPVQPTAQGATSAAGSEAAGGEAAGGEAALVAYINTQQGFSIDRPASWTQDTSAKDGVKFAGGDGVMTLVFVKPNVKDVLTYATNDAGQFAASQPNYKQVGLAPSTEVANAVLLGFETAGTSQVTGKAYPARGDRYYIALKDGRIAVLTVATSVRNYDGQGVRDIALTLKVAK